jgi:tubulin polyglutamylase TTLL5
MGIDMSLMWSKIYDIIIKSLLAVDSIIYQNLRKLSTKNSCFELLGFDILIDSDLKPWLLEINLSPSLATDTPLDLKIKTNLVVDTFNLSGIKKFDRRRDNLTKMKNRVKNIMRAKSYQSRQNTTSQGQSKGQ